ncbi:hypothetical protein FQN60_013988 [Etheostoma spectabile]|uniref:SOS1/NGEF-like PH domain-containing protein n=1 Tax=Etheostoma spectabile TaxID=54343 RepID=A0A5J5CBE2_9PERO|nr:hypothetical protein FQN60_013988 [Etheostoma spectabile]
MQGSFNVWTDHKKGHSKTCSQLGKYLVMPPSELPSARLAWHDDNTLPVSRIACSLGSEPALNNGASLVLVKDLARFKPMQRHLFLYDKMMLFCKKREETTDGNDKTPSYSFKHSVKMSAVGITENVKGDIKKFEVWYNGREEVYIIQGSIRSIHILGVRSIAIVWRGNTDVSLVPISSSRREAHTLATSESKGLRIAAWDCSMNPTDHGSGKASQLNIYGVPMRNVRKMVLRQSDSSSPESGFRRTNPSPNMRQKRVEASASISGHSAAYARKRFTLEGLSNRRSLPAEPAVKEAVVPRRFSLASSSSFATRRTKGTLSASVKSKRHEIKSDPTPFGYEVRKRQSMTSSTATAAGGTPAVPRSTSQPVWAQQRLPSMDTDDFEPIPSSAEESSNSSEEEGNNKNVARDLSKTGDLVQFLKEAQSGQ